MSIPLKENVQFAKSPKYIYSFKVKTQMMFRTSLGSGDVLTLNLNISKTSIGAGWCEISQDRVCIVGGGRPTSKGIIIDVKKDFAVTKLAPMSTARKCHGLIYYADYLYAIGGNDGKVPLSSCERYAFDTTNWEGLMPLPISCSGLSLVISEATKSLFAIGGFDESYLDCIQKLNVVTLRWELLQIKLPYSESCIACFKVEPLIYLILGNILFEFNPCSLDLKQIMELHSSIWSYGGLSVFRDGVLYCPRYIGEAKQQRISYFS